MSSVDKLNFLGIAAQFIGFIIIARDLWPEYRKSKRKQMILWMVGFSRESERLLNEGKAKDNYFHYATYKDAFMESRNEIAKHEPKAPLKHYDDFLKEEDFRKFYSVVKENYENWITNIDQLTTFRSMYMGEAIFIVIAGYAVQMVALFMNAKVYPFTLIQL